jgi:transcriptional regulator with XRE-family HTH domain
MSEKLTLKELAALVKTKRGKKGLRDTAKEIGEISPSTLSRVEQGKMPDLETFLKLCEWLEISPNLFMKQDTEDITFAVSPDMTTPDMIEVHLRADKDLDADTAEAIAHMVRAAYNAVLTGKLGNKKRE